MEVYVQDKATTMFNGHSFKYESDKLIFDNLFDNLEQELSFNQVDGSPTSGNIF